MNKDVYFIVIGTSVITCLCVYVIFYTVRKARAHYYWKRHYTIDLLPDDSEQADGQYRAVINEMAEDIKHIPTREVIKRKSSCCGADLIYKNNGGVIDSITCEVCRKPCNIFGHSLKN